ncbi:arginine--tRNA ligase [Candidatus Micrarchaeota archaeon]|nr:arginine--tRNA ligase [Candidatus Micrarchaeota archaeon]MBD3418399.1 arginine--tRNA ligase [Candidatus Micrarchaeota archaeon]
MILNAKHQIASLISKATSEDESLCFKSLEVAQEGHGDIASKIGFMLAKKMRMRPVQAAQEVAEKLKPHEWVKGVEVAGPYINFMLSDEFYAEAVMRILQDGKEYGRGNSGKRVIVESPSVNPNKPWHIGHLRNALLGDAVANLLQFRGDHVQRMDYIDDLGLQVAQSLWGYLNLDKEIEGKADHWIGHEYVKVAGMVEKDEVVKKSAEGILREMENGGNETAEKARWLAEECVKAQYETAFNYGNYENVLICESDIMREIFGEGIEKLKASGAVTHETSGPSKGCWVVKLSGKMRGMTEPDKILIRSNGTATYTGKDMIFHLWKFGKLKGGFRYSKFLEQPTDGTAYITSKKGKAMDFGKADLVVNVIGVEQKYPQEVIKHVLDVLGYTKEAENFVHLAYEHAWLPEAKFSGRKGTWVGHTADELAAEGKKRALEKVKTGIPEGERETVAEEVAIGAIRYAFLKIAPEKKLVFKWDEVLSLEGDSGPYLQYACVRARRILEKADFNEKVGAYGFNAEEKRLVKELAQFPMIMKNAAGKMKPHLVSDYLYSLSNVFSKFYTNNPVIKAEKEEEKKMRLAMVSAFNNVLSTGLGVLGVPVPDKM